MLISQVYLNLSIKEKIIGSNLYTWGHAMLWVKTAVGHVSTNDRFLDPFCIMQQVPFTFCKHGTFLVTLPSLPPPCCWTMNIPQDKRREEEKKWKILKKKKGPKILLKKKKKNTRESSLSRPYSSSFSEKKEFIQQTQRVNLPFNK